MARPLRLEYEGAFYHITARGNERKNIFSGKNDRLKFLEYLREVKKKYGILLHSYVLMTNHYHLLVETPESNLSRAMHYINGSYTTYINTKKKRCGHLFQGRYKAILVDRDSYLIELSRYIHLNPVRAGIVQAPEDHQYSSYRAFISSTRDDLSTNDLILSMMAAEKKEASAKYRAYVEAGIGSEMESPLKRTYGGMILGAEQFIKDTLKRIKEDYLNKKEISHRSELRKSHGFKEILDQIAARYRVSPADILEGRNSEAKKVAIYLLKKHTGMANRDIGAQFGDISFSAIAKVCGRLEDDMGKDPTLRRTVRRIDEELSYVKG